MRVKVIFLNHDTGLYGLFGLYGFLSCNNKCRWVPDKGKNKWKMSLSGLAFQERI
ncbi:hypothetical protein CBFG_00988 [Clostridiales bacterium 1_7_47FAA]|nr:hypothetical protein CBFG_00988 [Clostridiales bacterium 1_7_47FAA]